MGVGVVPGSVTANSRLNVRGGAPRLTAPIVSRLQPGSVLPVLGKAVGDPVNGNTLWYRGLNDTYFWSGACSMPRAAPASSLPNSLTGRVESAPPAVLGFDIDRPLSRSDVQTFVARGFRFVVRYLTRAHSTENPGDLTRSEAETILSGGLALMAVQHVAKANWLPTKDLGAGYGADAAANAREVGLPPGINLWLDLEGVRADCARQDVLDYCNAWFAAVDGAGFASGLYVGEGIVISPDDIFWNLKTKHYWKSGSNVPEIPQRGYQMVQHIPPNADDKANVDRNITRTDALGGGVQWLTRA